MDLIPFNIERTRAVGEPIAVIKSLNQPASASSAKANTAGGILNSLILCKGSRVMLKSNLWGDKGLTNGAQGTVVDIIYKPGNSPPNLPDLVLVKVDQYIGPGFKDMDKVVPLVPKRMHWFSHGKDYYRTGLPIIPAYAISIHNSQGMSLDRVILNIGDKEDSVGITYTGMSRVRKFRNLAFKPMPNFDRLRRIQFLRMFKLRKKEDDRLKKLEVETIACLKSDRNS